MKLNQIIENAKINTSEFTGMPINSLTGMSKDPETNSLRLEIELLERKGIPDSMDLLGIYEVLVDEEGDICELSRTGMRKRGDKSIEQIEEY